jgi:hypothetical protein
MWIDPEDDGKIHSESGQDNAQTLVSTEEEVTLQAVIVEETKIGIGILCLGLQTLVCAVPGIQTLYDVLERGFSPFDAKSSCPLSFTDLFIFFLRTL